MIKTEILEALTTQWEATSIIARRVRYNFYDVLDALNQLEADGIIENKIRGATGSRQYWRVRDQPAKEIAMEQMN